ncbi:hypothetical protein [Aminobacter ciceronei]|uniref:hypothetical protein n=1 Tax=Aminobacter ciceronei TaxID=150723 RepID=UPI001FF04783|nr:hypothetical protein [Aminobacter ciceronei]
MRIVGGGGAAGKAGTDAARWLLVVEQAESTAEAAPVAAKASNRRRVNVDIEASNAISICCNARSIRMFHPLSSIPGDAWSGQLWL